MHLFKYTLLIVFLLTYSSVCHAGFWDKLKPAKEEPATTEAVVEKVALEEGSAETVTSAEMEDATSAKDAISFSKQLATTAEQLEYLLAQANRLLASEAFLQAKEIAQYILTHVDSQSVDAQGLLQAATDGLKKAASNEVAEIKSKFGF